MPGLAKRRTRIHWVVYFLVTGCGALFTMASLLSSSQSSDLAKNVYSVCCNLGAGALASGIMAWFFDALNAKIGDNIVAYKREAILAGAKAGVQFFLNESGNKYFELNAHGYGRSIQPREMVVRELLTTGKAFELRFLNEYGNGQIKGDYLRTYVGSVYGEASSIVSLADVARQVLADKQTLLVNGILNEDEMGLFEAIVTSVERIVSLASKGSYVALVPFVDMLYDTIRSSIAVIPEFRSFGEMTYVRSTVRMA